MDNNVDNNVQVVKMSKSILDYFRVEMDFDNEGQHYREVKEKEFINKLTESLNCGVANKEIVWVD
jgi:hypothetical protein